MKLKEIREARGMSQRQAALGLNLSPTVYNRYENGVREPSNAMLPVFSDFFGCTIDELLGREPFDASGSQPEDEVMALREELRRSPDMRMLFSAARRATPEHIRAATAVIKSLEPEEFAE